MNLKTPKLSMPWLRFLSAMLSLCLLSFDALGQSQTQTQVETHTISDSQLKQLSVELTAVKALSHYRGGALNAEVSSMPGAAYTMSSPINVQRVIYSKPRGTMVKKGESIATLIGTEVAHYHDAYELKTALYEQSEKLYHNNRKLYQQKAISEQQWLSISEHYMTQKLALGEYQHFFEYVEKFDHDTQSLALISPITGLLNYPSFSSLNIEQAIVTILPEQAIRVQVMVPSSQKNMLSAIVLPACTLKIEISENVAQSSFKRAWSEPITPNCDVNYGDIVTVSPDYAISAYRVPKSAVFSLGGEYYVMTQISGGFTSVGVTIVASEQDDYVVTTQGALAGTSVASTSVSALQGILMGLGE